MLCISVLAGCSDGSDAGQGKAQPAYDFSTLDARFQQFIAENDNADGISVILLDREQGVVFEANYGDHPENVITAIAGASMLASATTMMALQEDSTVGFDIGDPIEGYLPWDGVYGEVTTEQLLSGTSGIPALFSAANYEEYGCQYDADAVHETCSRLIYETEVPGIKPPGTVFDYGGTQTYMLGTLASQVTNSDWSQVFDKYVAQPCALEVFKYGNTANMEEGDFTGDPDSLPGTGNPHTGGGGMSSLRDMATLVLMHLRDGMCGDNQVLSPDAVLSMRKMRTDGLTNIFYPGRAYGMGWWSRDDLPPEVLYASGGYGDIAWIDTGREIGGYVAVDDYSKNVPYDYINLVWYEIIPMFADIVDEARGELEP